MTKSQLSPPHPSMEKIKKNQWKCNQHLIKMNFGTKKFVKFFLDKFEVQHSTTTLVWP